MSNGSIGWGWQWNGSGGTLGKNGAVPTLSLDLRKKFFSRLELDGWLTYDRDTICLGCTLGCTF
ncbi:MAG: hypothetical protein LBH53_00165 [Puniceicoccales bacterium]|nr:hypothetical protein [Puniceicoccales bacterium]